MTMPALFCEIERPLVKGRMKKPKVQKQAEFSMRDEQLKMLEAKTIGELFKLARKHIPFNDMPEGLWSKLEKACNSKEPI